jgi:hypothetical protein
MGKYSQKFFDHCITGEVLAILTRCFSIFYFIASLTTFFLFNPYTQYRDEMEELVENIHDRYVIFDALCNGIVRPHLKQQREIAIANTMLPPRNAEMNESDGIRRAREKAQESFNEEEEEEEED